MENASKALIIAGAILISILLISLGILIYNQATNITNGDQMNEVEVSNFNSKFLQYEGDNATGTQVKSLVNQVIASNASASNEERKIEIEGEVTGSDTEFDTTGIVNSKRYKIHITEYYTGGTPHDGCVKKIKIEQ